MSLRSSVLRIFGLFQRRRLDRELDEEIVAHLEATELDAIAAGMSEEEARRAAKRQFGGVEQMKEEHRDLSRLRFVESLGQDLRYSLRSIRRSAGHSALITVTVALGIAGSSAVFSVYDRLFLRPLPFPEAHRLVDLDERIPGGSDSIRMAYSNFLEWRERAQSFEGMAAWAEDGYNLRAGDVTERVQGARVTHDFLQVLRMEPALGRMFTPEEDREHGPNVAMIGHDLWRRRFDSRQNVLGEAIELNGVSYEIVGILPAGPSYPDGPEVWTPLQEDPQHGIGWFLLGIARLKDGVSLEAAREEMAGLHARLEASRGEEFVTAPVLSDFRLRHLGEYRAGTLLLLAGVVVVLLIAAGNAAGLWLAAGLRRRTEMMTRLALGASRGRVVRQFMAESLLVAAAGGALGVLLGWRALHALLEFRPAELPGWMVFELDGRFLLAAVAASLLVGLVAGGSAAWTATRGAAGSASARGSAGKRDRRGLNALVVGQSALTLALLLVLGLLVQALDRVHEVDPGFRSDNVLTFTMSLPGWLYPQPRQRAEFFQELVARLETLPGVVAAGAISLAPLENYSATNFVVEGAARESVEPEPPVLTQATVPGYFESMGMNLIEGRWFDERESQFEAAAAVIVNEAFARQHFPHSSPVGRRIRYGYREDSWMTIVGVVGDVRHFGLEKAAPLGAYIPLSQGRSYSSMTMTVKTRLPPVTLVPDAQRVAQAMDPTAPMYGVMTLTERLNRTLLMRRTYSWLTFAFALLALLLTAAGIYGVTSRLVGQRRREIGIRMALGEGRDSVQGGIVRQSLTLTSLGALFGSAFGIYTAVWMESLLFGVKVWTPLPLLCAGGVLLAVSLTASYIPARRAAGVNPAEVLRME